MPKYTRTATWALALFLLFSLPALAQTDGAPIVSSIESKAGLLTSNEKKILQLEQQIEELKEKKKTEGDKRMKDKLYEIENSTSWKNRRKSAQSGWKEYSPGTCSAGGPPPICTARHWYSVSVSEAMAEYEAFKQKALDEVRKQIAAAEQNYENKINDLLQQIAQLKDKNLDLRDEIVELSKRYKDKVMEQAKSLHALWVGELMRLVAEKHYAEDRINIYGVKLNDLAQEETKALAELKDKVTKKTEADKQALNNKISANKIRAYNLEQAYENRIEPLNDNLSTWKARLYSVNNSLLSASLTASDKEKLQAEKTDLEGKIASAEKQLADYETAYENEKQGIEAQNKDYADQVWKLTTGLSKIIEDAQVNVRKAFAAKRTILNDALVARRASLEEVSRLLMEKKEAYRGKNNQFVSKVDDERIRMMAACSKVGAGCYGTDAAGSVVANWNKVSGCVGEMESAHHSNDVIYACEQETPVYRQYYSSLKSGMSDSDRSALQRTASRTRYDMIFKKIMD